MGLRQCSQLTFRRDRTGDMHTKTRLFGDISASKTCFTLSRPPLLLAYGTGYQERPAGLQERIYGVSGTPVAGLQEQVSGTSGTVLLMRIALNPRFAQPVEQR